MKKGDRELKKIIGKIFNRFRPSVIKKKYNPRNLKITIIASAVLLGVFFMQPYRFAAILETDSIDCRAFIWEKTDHNDNLKIKKGDYLTFKVNVKDIAPHLKDDNRVLKLVKKVGCPPGGYLECGFGVCTCNGEVIVESIDERFAAQAFNYTGEIPPTHVFLIGDTENTFDGRYWGLTEIDVLVGKIQRCLYSVK